MMLALDFSLCVPSDHIVWTILVVVLDRPEEIMKWSANPELLSVHYPDFFPPPPQKCSSATEEVRPYIGPSTITGSRLG